MFSFGKYERLRWWMPAFSFCREGEDWRLGGGGAQSQAINFWDRCMEIAEFWLNSRRISRWGGTTIGVVRIDTVLEVQHGNIPPERPCVSHTCLVSNQSNRANRCSTKGDYTIMMMVCWVKTSDLMFRVRKFSTWYACSNMLFNLLKLILTLRLAC